MDDVQGMFGILAAVGIAFALGGLLFALKKLGEDADEHQEAKKDLYDSLSKGNLNNVESQVTRYQETGKKVLKQCAKCAEKGSKLIKR